MLSALRRCWLVQALLLAVSLPHSAGQALADDWPQWGGPQRDLVWRETGIVDRLPSGLLPRVWSRPLGEGYTGPAVADGRVLVSDFLRQSSNRGEERIWCFDAETGEVLWQDAWLADYTISYPNGPRATPVVDGNRVYVLGALGAFTCRDVRSGEILWQKDFRRDFGTELPTWGMAAAPLIVGQQVIALVGGKDGALVVSFDKRNGQERWRALEDPEVGYCPPVLFEFGGTPQVIVWHPAAVSSLDPESGKVLWEVPFAVRAGLTISTPRQIGQRLFVTAFYNGPLMLEVARDGQSAKVVWRGKSNSEIETDGLHSIMPTPFVDETHIYGVCSYGQLRCLDARNGERVWESRQATGSGRWWNVFLVRHQDRFFLHNEQGDLIIAKLTPQGYRELSRARLIEPTRRVGRRMTIWSHPAFAMRSVFARNDKEIVRVDLSAEAE